MANDKDNDKPHDEAEEPKEADTAADKPVDETSESDPTTDLAPDESEPERPDPEATEEDMATDEEQEKADEPDEPAKDGDKEAADEPEAEDEQPDAKDDEPEADESDDKPADEEPEEPEQPDEPDEAADSQQDVSDDKEPEKSEPAADDASDEKSDEPDKVPDESSDDADEQALAEASAALKAHDKTASAKDTEDFHDMKFDAPDPNAPAAGDIVAELEARKKAQAEEAGEDSEGTDAKPGKGQSSIAAGKVVVGGRRSHTGLWVGLLLLVLAAAGALWWFKYRDVLPVQTTSKQVQQKADTATADRLTLDASKDYGDKYADGILPVGDDKMVTDAPKVGYIYACDQYAQSQNGGGAEARGPWFTNKNTEYDLNKKVSVQGNVSWTPSVKNAVSGGYRTITTNDLPAHKTGTFPVAANDPAYTYDTNPNSIKAQNLTYKLSASPAYQSVPKCMGGESGVMLDGVALFNGFDAGARDAGAWEVQDSCGGHPQKDGMYHYHTFSSCIKQVDVKTVVGYALDGFPITGPQIAKGNVLTTSDLDECHGITSQIMLDGKKVTMYHYVMTQDFPYSVSCFRGTPITPPGQNIAGQSPQGGQTGGSAPAATQPKPDATLPPQQ